MSYMDVTSGLHGYCGVKKMPSGEVDDEEIGIYVVHTLMADLPLTLCVKYNPSSKTFSGHN